MSGAAPGKLLAGALGTVLAVAVVCAQAPPPDPVLQALRDEAVRSSKLNLPNLETPYFVEYVLDESDDFSVAASLGGIASRWHTQVREPEVRVLGDERLDALRGEVEAVRLDGLEHARQCLLGAGREARAGSAGKQESQNPGAGAQFPTLSCWISQRPSPRASTSVLVVVVDLSTSER